MSSIFQEKKVEIPSVLYMDESTRTKYYAKLRSTVGFIVMQYFASGGRSPKHLFALLAVEYKGELPKCLTQSEFEGITCITTSMMMVLMNELFISEMLDT